MTGIFITRGMRIRIPAGGLAISMKPNGELDSSIRFQVSLDMCPYWLEIALQHLEVARDARAEVVSRKATGEDATLGHPLEREFGAGMQALTSGVIAIDALYASVKERTTIPDSLVAAWREKKTARHRQVGEVFRRAFSVGPKGFLNLKRTLGQLYRFRDLAVHPAAKFSDPVLHPVLGSATEWRFVSFGYDSAHTAARGALALAIQLARAPREPVGNLADYCAELLPRLDPLVTIWRHRFGPLLDADPADTLPSALSD